MLTTPSGKVFVSCAPCDMRRGIESLARIVECEFGYDPFAEATYVFISRTADKMKMLRWDADGFWLWYKKLSKEPTSMEGRPMKDQLGLFDEADRLARLSAMGDPLEKVASTIDWESFRPALEAALATVPADAGGRPHYDCVLMFKIAMLQQWYNIADDMTEYLICDRISFQRFLGIGLGDKVPDAKTIWLFKDRLAKAGAAKGLFDLFSAALEATGTITRKGSIVDASFVDVPRQRNSKKDNDTIKSGAIPEEWTQPDSAHKLAQKDTDARWTKKDKETHYGYKDHIKADATSKLIVDYAVTDASVHDSKALLGLVGEGDKALWADSAYVGEELHGAIRKKCPELVLNIHEKGYRNHPLTDAQKASNKEKLEDFDTWYYKESPAYLYEIYKSEVSL